MWQSECPVCGKDVARREITTSGEFECPSCGERLRVRRSHYKLFGRIGLLIAAGVALTAANSSGGVLLLAVILLVPVSAAVGAIGTMIVPLPLEAVPERGFRHLGDE